MADSRIPRDVHEAIHRMVLDFATKTMSGPERLAQITGGAPGTIYNKANPNETGHHKPTVSDLIAWTNATGNPVAAQSFCLAVGGAFVALPDVDGHSDAALLDLVLIHQKELGDFAAALGEALAKGRITRGDWPRLSKEGLEAVSAMMVLMSRIEGMVG
ncbi:MAG: phage regulatory CII family protein [Betaproteobacteria bacterium]|nr:phage regulatory CII family protein [Betaproteobacteria bacterium]